MLKVPFPFSQVRAIQNTEVECILFLPTSSEKIDYFKKLNASVRLHGTDCVETEMFAKQYAKVFSCTDIIKSKVEPHTG